jgi:hypothetical protein
VRTREGALLKARKERAAAAEKIRSEGFRPREPLFVDEFQKRCAAILKTLRQEYERTRRHLMDCLEGQRGSSTGCLPGDENPDDGGWQKGPPEPQKPDKGGEKPSESGPKSDAKKPSESGPKSDAKKPSEGGSKPDAEKEDEKKPSDGVHKPGTGTEDEKKPKGGEHVPSGKKPEESAGQRPPSLPLPFEEPPTDAVKMYELARGHEFVALPTSGSGFQCGVNAIERSVEAMYLELKGLTAQALLEILDSTDYKDIVNDGRFIYTNEHGERITPDNREFFSIDQLASMVGLWAYYHGGLDLRVGVVRNDYGPEAHGGKRDGQTIIIWIHYDNADERSRGQEFPMVDHYSGFKRKPRDTHDEALAKKQAADKAAADKKAAADEEAAQQKVDEEAQRKAAEAADKAAAEQDSAKRAAAEKVAAEQQEREDAQKKAEAEAQRLADEHATKEQEEERRIAVKEAAEQNAIENAQRKAAEEARRLAEEQVAKEQEERERKAREDALASGKPDGSMGDAPALPLAPKMAIRR